MKYLYDRYYIINMGRRRESTFLTNKDYKVFLGIYPPRSGLRGESEKIFISLLKKMKQ